MQTDRTEGYESQNDSWSLKLLRVEYRTAVVHLG